VGGTPTAGVLDSPPPRIKSGASSSLPNKGGGKAFASYALASSFSGARRWWPAWLGPGSWALYALGLTPAAWTFYLAVTDQLGADPLKVLERSLGLWALRFLVLGLAITPLRRIGGPNLLRYRRTVGLLAFCYALLHVTVYAWLDQGLDAGLIWKDIVKRPYITVGLASFLILIPLAATSNATMIRRLGAAAWQRLHRWVYLAAAAAAVHFIMLVKAWPVEPFVYAAIVAALLMFRVADRFRRPANRNANAK
jgi:sulfoxide reductase heme-binding subunit YedZ